MSFYPGIVVYDPSPEVGRVRPNVDGEVEPGPNGVAQAIARGCAVLPFDPDRLDEDAPSGYCRRGWGRSGYRVDAPGGVAACPMSVRLVPGRPWLYWVAVVMATGPGSRGNVRLVGDRAGSNAGGFSDSGGELVELGDLGKDIGPYGRRVIGGRRRVSAVGESVLNVRLRVAGSAVAVLVAAVSQSRVDVSYP